MSQDTLLAELAADFAARQRQADEYTAEEIGRQLGKQADAAYHFLLRNEAAMGLTNRMALVDGRLRRVWRKSRKGK